MDNYRRYKTMQEIKNIGAKTLNQWLENHEVLLIDVREIDEFNAERIPEARNIPLSQICTEEPDISEYSGKKIVIQCRSGARSMTACAKFLEANPSLEIYNLEGGIIDWKRCGYKTQS
jgi:rhodanese-related sulfurtransferase